jgi:hypothetical protein
MMRISLQQGEVIMDPLTGDSLSKNQLQEQQVVRYSSKNIVASKKT